MSAFALSIVILFFSKNTLFGYSTDEITYIIYPSVLIFILSYWLTNLFFEPF